VEVVEGGSYGGGWEKLELRELALGPVHYY
jgi:hypothetical protein